MTGAQAQPSDQGFYRAVEELEKAQEKEQQEAEKGEKPSDRSCCISPPRSRKASRTAEDTPVIIQADSRGIFTLSAP